MEKSNLLSPSTSTQLNNIQIDITLGRSSLAWAGTLNEANCRLYRLISLQSNVSELSMSGWLWQFARQFRASGLQVCTCIGTDGPGDRQIRHHASWDTGNRKLRREVGYRVTDKVRESSKGERKHPLTLWRQSSSKLSLTSLVSVLYIVENNIAWTSRLVFISIWEWNIRIPTHTAQSRVKHKIFHFLLQTFIFLH